MALSANENKTSKQIQVGTALAAVLQQGEALVEYCAGKFNVGFLSNQEFWIGLTNRRFIFMRPKKRQQVYSISFPFIDAVSTSQKASLSLLSIRLHPAAGFPPLKEELVFTASNKSWNSSLLGMVSIYSQLTTLETYRPEVPTAGQAAQQARDLYGLGAFSIAQDLLQGMIQVSPFIQAEPGVQEMLKMMRDTRLSMRLAAGIFAIVLLFLAYLAIRGEATLLYGFILAILAIVDLLRGRSGGRTNALGLGLLTVVLNVIFNAIAGSLLDVIVWGSFGLALLLLLAGSPDRLRIAAGVTAFAVGSVGLFVFVVVGSIYFPGVANIFLPKPSGPFVDNFSTDQKWMKTQDDKVSVGLENGAYAIQVKQPALSYLSFPPISYFSNRAEVDVYLPEGGLTENDGAYGLICRYQKNLDKYYVAYIDPLMGQFAIFRLEGNNDAIPLTNPPLQDLQGMKEASQPNRIGLACQNNQVTLTLNGVQQAQVSDPQMAQFGEGQMGLMVSTFEVVPAGGFKVLFDNASFWP